MQNRRHARRHDITRFAPIAAFENVRLTSICVRCNKTKLVGAFGHLSISSFNFFVGVGKIRIAGAKCAEQFALSVPSFVFLEPSQRHHANFWTKDRLAGSFISRRGNSETSQRVLTSESLVERKSQHSFRHRNQAAPSFEKRLCFPCCVVPVRHHSPSREVFRLSNFFSLVLCQSLCQSPLQPENPPAKNRPWHFPIRHRLFSSASFSGDAASTENSVRTKLPFAARPGPLAGRFGSVNASRRNPVIPLSFVFTVTRVNGNGRTRTRRQQRIVVQVC